MSSLLQPHLLDDQLFDLRHTGLFDGIHSVCYPRWKEIEK
jgi:hypothetical protein